MIDLLFDGGVFNLAASAAFLAGLIAIAVEVRLAGRTRFPGLDEGLVTGVLGLGLVGTWLGLHMAVEAMRLGSAENLERFVLHVGGIVVIPMVFAAGYAAVLGAGAAIARRSETRSTRDRVRPAPAVGPVTAGAVISVLLSLCLGAGSGMVFLPALVRTGSVEQALQTTWALQSLHTGLMLGLAAVGFAALNVGMGIVGGWRGLAAD